MSRLRQTRRQHARRLYARSVVGAPWAATLLRRWWVVLVALGFAVPETARDVLDRSWWVPGDVVVVGLLAWRLVVLLRRRRGGRGGAPRTVGEWYA